MSDGALRLELARQGRSTDGLKPALIARLQQNANPPAPPKAGGARGCSKRLDEEQFCGYTTPCAAQDLE